ALALLLSQATRAQTVRAWRRRARHGAATRWSCLRRRGSVRRAGGIARGVAAWRACRGRRLLFLLRVPACPGIARGRRAAVVGDVEAAALKDDADGVNNAANRALALRADGEGIFLDPLAHLKTVAAMIAQIVVEGHTYLPECLAEPWWVCLIVHKSSERVGSRRMQVGRML